MKILEHTETRLVIKDGSRWYASSPMPDLLNLIGEKWQRAIKVCFAIASISLGIAWLAGKIPTALQPVATILLFFWRLH